jgi:hypothetical protein
MNDANEIVKASQSLSDLYQQQDDFKKAFMYAKMATTYADNLRNLSKGSDIALLEVDREYRQHEEELRQVAQRQNSKRNIQYMAISIVIVTIFVIMLIIGMFPVSRVTIRMLGYFFFISLFEFIVLIIDNSFLAQALHYEPLKLWLIKIVLIALLVPMQHFLEHNLITFLESKKLLEARAKFSFKKWWDNIKKPTPVTVADLEEDTAVL